MSVNHGQRNGLIGAALAVLVMLCLSLGLRAEVVNMPEDFYNSYIRVHGITTVDQDTDMIIYQQGPILRYGLQRRMRPVGQERLALTAKSDEGAYGRLTKIRWMFETRAERLKPAAPNYFQSAAELYRYTFQGIEFLPDDAWFIEVNAGLARNQFAEEINRFRKDAANQTEVDALYYAVMVAQAIYKEGDLMPAPGFATTLKGASGAIRVDPATLARNPLPAGRQLVRPSSIEKSGVPKTFGIGPPSSGLREVRTDTSLTAQGLSNPGRFTGTGQTYLKSGAADSGQKPRQNQTVGPGNLELEQRKTTPGSASIHERGMLTVNPALRGAVLKPPRSTRARIRAEYYTPAKPFILSPGYVPDMPAGNGALMEPSALTEAP